MTLSSPSLDADPQSSLVWKYDAIHGYVDIHDPVGDDGVIRQLLSSPVLQRLRRIKQLGFASQSYPAADHSRYAHALGTMHTMRMLLRRLLAVNGLPSDLFGDLKACFPRTFRGNITDDSNILMQHMLVAALLQDVGELPFNQSSIYFFRPSNELRGAVEDSVGFPVGNWDDKDIFTIGYLSSIDFAHGLGSTIRLAVLGLLDHWTSECK